MVKTPAGRPADPMKNRKGGSPAKAQAPMPKGSKLAPMDKAKKKVR